MCMSMPMPMCISVFMRCMREIVPRERVALRIACSMDLLCGSLLPQVERKMVSEKEYYENRYGFAAEPVS